MDAVAEPFFRRLTGDGRVDACPGSLATSTGNLAHVMSLELRTDRLLLRRWRPADLAPYAAINREPEVTEFLAGPLSRAESDAMVERIERGFDEEGFGLWAVERLDTGEMVGFTGLSRPSFEAPFLPAVEIGWRLARPAWGHGFATEAARSAVADGFTRAGLSEIVSFTAVGNLRSRAVMERLDMTHDPAEDFDHPNLPDGHPLRRHVLYRLDAPAGGSSEK
jgi:ribosomal-protein-alanine N-acetyltransferase